MKLTRSEILKLASKEPYQFTIERLDTKNDPYLIGIRDVRGEIYFDDLGDDKISALVKLKGEMICPCAMTLEEVFVPLAVDEEVYLAKIDDHEDNYIFTDELDLDDFILKIVSPYAPIKVVKNGKIEYPIGDGWRVLSEDMLKDLRRDEIDPRLAKLMEYKFDDDEKE